MLADDRLNAIVRMVTEAGSMSVADLAEALDVTASTIRRDLQTLDRVHRSRRSDESRAGAYRA